MVCGPHPDLVPANFYRLTDLPPRLLLLRHNNDIPIQCLPML